MDILNKLGIKDINFGGCSGPGNWTKGQNEGLTESFNPANGELIASVYNCSKEDYTDIVKKSHESFLEWRKVPSPERGQFIRIMGNALRDNKDALGSLVSLEMGKIMQEGDG